MKIILTPQQKQQLEEMHESTVARHLSDMFSLKNLSLEMVMCNIKTAHRIKRLPIPVVIHESII